MSLDVSRRAWLTGVSSALALSASSPAGMAASVSDLPPISPQFRYGLNTYTIHGQNLPLPEEIDLVADAGYDGIEIWIMELDQYVKNGGSLGDIAKRIRDRGLVVYDTIGFPEWAVDDDARRAKGVEEVKRSMELAQKIGGQRLAAPPMGAGDHPIDPRRVAERYRVLLEIGTSMGVIPQLEIWGHSKTLGRLGDAAHIAIEADHPAACVLADVYHLYKGGSSFTGLKMLSKQAIQVFHMNDYPQSPPRAEINDAARVYPGDGTAPWKEIIGSLTTIGFDGFLSLELFNRDYWKRDARAVARTGLAKMRAVVQGAQNGSSSR